MENERASLLRKAVNKITLISIVIPALNEEKYIKNCLKSLKSQKYEGEYEIIVIDNGSTDKTPEIAEEYADKVIYRPNLDFYDLCNEGLRHSNGDIIARIDADCIADPLWLSEACFSLEECPNSVLVSGAILPLEKIKIFEILLYLYNTFMNVSINHLYFAAAHGGNSAFYREKAKKIGGFKNYFPEDGQFGKDMNKVGKLVYNPDMKVHASMRRYIEEGVWDTALELISSHLRLRWGDKKDFEETEYWTVETN